MLNLTVKDVASVLSYPLVMNDMGSRIKTLRESKGLVQEQLGKIIGVSKSAVSQWEDGSTENIRLKHFFGLCTYFAVDPLWLAFGTAEMPRSPIAGFPLSDTGRFRLRYRTPKT